MLLSARYPAATWEPVSYAGKASLMSAGSLGWVEHVVVGNGDPWGTFEHAPADNRRFSHLWFGKSGQVRQYQDLQHDSWAQVAGNDSYWSCETEGDPSEALTDQQLDALAAWHVWSGTADAIATVPGQRGIGTHSMGGQAWGGHACPGPIRAGQRTEILRRAAALRTGGNVAGKFTREDLAPAWAVTWGDESAADRLAAAAHGSALLPVLSHLVDLSVKQSNLLAKMAEQVAQLQATVAALTLKS